MYYVAGNLFVTGYVDSEPIRVFGLVRSSGSGLFYITKSSNGLKSTSHHASLYKVKETDKWYILTRVKQRDVDSPSRVSVPKDSTIGNCLRESIQYAEANNKFYE